MKIYAVGGCVRDQLLGRTPKDFDYVVTGATEEEMLALNYQKVGAAFPVFLKNGEEYALARKERKTGVGYHGFEVVFDPTVTLEEDLLRRDCTINSMAMDLETSELVDPYGGQHDLAQGILRATSEAFSDDPVRVLRTARFASRYNFKVAPDTMDLMRKIVHELEHVPKERIWAEFEKGLMEDHPVQMFEVLEKCGALEDEVLRPYTGADWRALENVNARDPIEARFIVISTQFKGTDWETYKIPSHLSKAAKFFNNNAHGLYNYDRMPKNVRLGLLKDARAINDKTLINTCIQAMYILWPACRANLIDQVVARINEDLTNLQSLDCAMIASSCISGENLRHVIEAAQLDVMS